MELTVDKNGDIQTQLQISPKKSVKNLSKETGMSAGSASKATK
jgi:hypothetical protein